MLTQPKEKSERNLKTKGNLLGNGCSETWVYKLDE